MKPGLCLDSGEFITAEELNRRIDMTRITDRELQSLRNTGNVSEDAADEIIELRQRAELDAQLASWQEPVDERAAFEAWATRCNPGPDDYRLLRTPHANKPYAREWVREAWEAWQARAAHPAPAQQPLSRDEIADLYRETEPQCSLFTFRDIAADIEAAHHIKEKQ